MHIRSKRHLSGTFAWALSLAALIFVAGLVAAFLQETPDRARHARSDRLRRRRVRRRPQLAARQGTLARPARPADRVSNRVLLEDRIEQALRRARRTGEPFTLIVVDLDGFKDVNDVRGHGAGDAVLRSLARRFEAILRSSDTVARVGGDEFVVLSLGTRDDEQASARRRPAAPRPAPPVRRRRGDRDRRERRLGGLPHGRDLGRAPGQGGPPDVRDEARRGGRGAHAEAGSTPASCATSRPPSSAASSSSSTSPSSTSRRGAARRGGARPPPPPRPRASTAADFVHVERTPIVRELTFLVVADALRSAQLWRDAGHDLHVLGNVPYRLVDDTVFA